MKKNRAAKLGGLAKNNDSLFSVICPRQRQHFIQQSKIANFPKMSPRTHARTHTRTRAHSHTHSVFSLIFVHIPLTSLSPTINILPVRLDKSVGFGHFMEKKKGGGGKYR